MYKNDLLLKSLTICTITKKFHILIIFIVLHIDPLNKVFKSIQKVCLLNILHISTREDYMIKKNY